MAKANLTFNLAGWDELVAGIIDTGGVARMQRVAEAANAADGLDDGYRVSVQGDRPLRKADYRATVIAATHQAKRRNAKNNTLVRNLHRAGGAS